MRVIIGPAEGQAWSQATPFPSAWLFCTLLQGMAGAAVPVTLEGTERGLKKKTATLHLGSSHE